MILKDTFHSKLLYIWAKIPTFTLISIEFQNCNSCRPHLSNVACCQIKPWKVWSTKKCKTFLVGYLFSGRLWTVSPDLDMDTFITRMATLSLMTEEDILSTLTDNHSTLGCCLFSSSVLHWYLWERLLSVAASSYLMEIISPSNKPYQRLRIKYIPYGDIFFSCGFGFTYED